VFGCPEQIISDLGGDGGEFNNELLKTIYEMGGITKLNTAGYQPQALGKVEKINRTMISFLAKNCKNHDEWEAKLPLLMWEYNGRRNSITRYSPAYLMFGRELRTPMDLVTRDLKELNSWETEHWHDSGVPGLLKAINKAIKRFETSQMNTAKLYNESNRY
jgi:hypothetical protein